MSIEKLENIISDYIEEANVVIKNQKPLSGIFGFGNSIGNNACHAKFYDAISKELSEGDYEPYEAVKFLIYADRNYECPKSVQMMLTTIQGLAIPFVSSLSDVQKDEFREYYDKNIKKHYRLPIQDKLYKELKR